MDATHPMAESEWLEECPTVLILRRHLGPSPATDVAPPRPRRASPKPLAEPRRRDRQVMTAAMFCGTSLMCLAALAWMS